MNARFDTTRLLPREGEAIWDYWLSLNPIAPVFGVPWRFGEVLGMSEADVALAPKAKAKPKSKTKPAVKSLPSVATSVKPVVAAAPSGSVAAKPAVKAPVKMRAKDTAKTAAKKATVKETAKPIAAAPVAKVAKAAPVKPAEPAKPDELTLIKGVGPKMAEKLNAAGVTTFAQIATWDAAKIAEMGELLGGLPGAIQRADWVGQAKDLV